MISYGITSNKVLAKTDYYEVALQAYYQNDIDAAFIHLKNALRENSDNLPAKLLLAEILIKKRLYSSAEHELNDAVMKGADINLVLSPLGRSLLLQGKFDLALQFADQKKLHKQGMLAFNLIKAEAYLGLSNKDKAEDLYNTILLNNPHNVEAMLGLASIYNTRNKAKESQALLDKIALIAPKNSEMWQIKGQLARNNGELETSIAHFNKANELEPDNIATLRSLASSYIELQKLEKAQVLVVQILASNPNDLQTQLMKGNILRSLGDRELSHQVLNKLSNQLSSIDESYMLSQPPLLLIDAMSSYGQENWLQAQKKFKVYINQGIEGDDVSSIILLADVYVKLEKPEQALELLSSYESQLIKNKDYALILTGLYLQFNQDFKADYVLNKLRGKYSNDEDVLILSAKLLSKMGQGETALSLLESANVQDSLQFKHTLAVIALQLGELDKSLTYTQSLISMSPDVIEYQLLYTRVLLQRGQFDSAEKIIVNLYTKHSDNREVRYNYALLQFNTDNLSEAKKLFGSLVQEDPSDGKSWFVLAQIAHDLGDIDETVRILERQTKNEEYRNRALHKLVQIHYAQQEFEKSLLIINVLLRSNRLDAQAISMKAKNLIALKQIKEAKRQLDILLGLWSEDARNLLQLSKLQLRINDLIGAENSLETAYAMEPKALPIIIDSIKSKIRLNKLAEASTLLVKAEKNGHKGNIYLIILKGDIENAKNNGNAAFNYYLTALKKDDANIIALVKLSQVSTTKTLSKKYIKQLSYLVNKHPERTLQRHTFADHLLAHKKFEQAKLQYQVLITQDIPPSKRALALNNLATIYLNENAHQSAVDVSKQAFEMLPSPAIIDTLGWSLVLLGDTNKGLSYLRQAFSMSSNRPDIQYHIAYALVELNRKEEAKALLMSITKLPDTFIEHKLAKQLLSTL